MKPYKLPCLITLLLAIPVAHATTIFSHTFNEGTGGLNGTAVDTGTGSWVAAPAVTANGVFSTDLGSATLAYTPSQGTQYQLDARITSVTGDANWVALGFANGTSPDANSTSRFTSQTGVQVEGRAWMLFRGDTGTNGNVAWTEGTLSGNNAIWTGPLATADGGDIDLRILLDTTGGATNWTATWFAKRPTDGSYTEIRSAASLPNEDITAVGFAFSSATGAVDGILESFSLTQIPEPSSTALLGLAGIALFIRRRR